MCLQTYYKFLVKIESLQLSEKYKYLYRNYINRMPAIKPAIKYCLFYRFRSDVDF